MRPKILVLGPNGQLGRELVQSAWPYPADIVSLDRTSVDLSVEGQARHAIAAIRPDIVINAAAYTAVDKAEQEPDLAFAINSSGPEEIAIAAAALNAPVLHISTDYVFDGRKERPYVETDAIGPLNVYGASKAQGEARLRDNNRRHLIIRTSWVYARNGHNFVRTMLRLGRERSELRVVDDQVGAPTSAADLAAAIIRIAPYILENGDLSGTYHLTAEGVTSWHGFAEAIFADMHRRVGHRPVLVPIATSEYPTPARRPQNSCLDCGKFHGAFGFSLPDWKESLMPVLALLNADKT